MDLDWEKYLTKYPNVSREELESIRDNVNRPVFCERVFEFRVSCLNEERGKEKIHGKPAVRAGPLLQVLSVDIQPIDVCKRKSLGVFGKIYSDNHYIYDREYADVEVLGPGGGTLTLIGPSLSCPSSQAFLSPGNTKFLTTLYDEGQNVLVQDSVSLEYANDEFEEVKVKSVRGHQVLFSFTYVSIPMAVYARLKLKFFNKKYSKKVTQSPAFVNVYGNISAQYKKTFGNYDLQKILLFEKKSNEYERVGVDLNNNLNLSRYWVAVPAYSLLLIHVDLFEYETGDRIMEEIVELDTKSYLLSSKSFVVGDFIIEVSATWFPPEPHGEYESKDECCDDDGDEVISSFPPKEGGDMEELDHSWTLNPHVSKPFSSPAIEVFSVIIGREKWKALKMYGFIEVSADYSEFNLFKKDENYALRLLERSKTVPVLEGSRLFADFCPLKITCDLKDVLGQLKIKGYVDWDASILDSCLYHDKQLCSVILGDHGFAALHYTIFSSAVQVHLKVFYKQKILEHVDVPFVFGSLFAQYGTYDYSTQYNKDCYRIVLFKSIQEDSRQVSEDGMIPLSRSTIVVPSHSSLVIDLDLTSNMSSQRLLCTREFEIGASPMSIETNECIVHFELEWTDVK